MSTDLITSPRPFVSANFCSSDKACPYHASGGPKTLGCGGDAYHGLGARPTDPVLAALLTASPTEARAVLEALAQWVENEQCNDEREDAPSPMLVAAEALLDRLNLGLATQGAS